jgi:hypothetical protein
MPTPPKPAIPLPPYKTAEIAKIQQAATSLIVATSTGSVESLAGDAASIVSANDVLNAKDTNKSVFQAGADSLLGKGGAESFTVLRYPNTDLGTDEYPHYVMFFISERKNSISAAESVMPSSVQFDYSKKNLWVDETAANVLGIGVGAVVGGQLGSKVASAVTPSILSRFGRNADGAVDGGKTTFLTNITQAVAVTGGALVGGAIGGAITSGADVERSRVLLKKAIALYLPHKPSASYNAEWASEDLGVIGGAAASLKNVKDADGFVATMGTLRDSLGGFAKSAFLTAGTKLNTPGFGNVGGALQASLAQVPNPFKAQLFKAMGFRQFAFEYSFLPRNSKEFQEVQEIIYTFKRFMHPTLGAEKFIMSYPAEFTLGFYHKDHPNENLFKISSCALTSMDINYGGTDFTTFRSAPGAPTEITMRLNFMELEMLTRDRIEVGY